MNKWQLITALTTAIFFSSFFSSNVMAGGSGFSLKTDNPGNGVELTTSYTKHYHGRQGHNTFSFNWGLALQGSTNAMLNSSNASSTTDTNFDQQEQSLQQDLDGFKLNPVIALGLSWIF